MILDNPAIRLVLKVISAFGLMDNQRDSAVSRGNRVREKDSPFVLVACAADGKWRVFQQDFDKPLAEFDELQPACDYASTLARTRMDTMVLIGNRPETAANRSSSLAQGSI